MNQYGESSTWFGIAWTAWHWLPEAGFEPLEVLMFIVSVDRRFA